MAAMSAAMLALGERIAAELGRGELDQVYIKGDSGYVLLMSVTKRPYSPRLLERTRSLVLPFLICAVQ